MSGKDQQQQQQRSKNEAFLSEQTLLIFWYILWGAVHELSHIVAAFGVGAGTGLLHGGGWIPLLYRIMFGRCVMLPAITEDNEFIVRHTGWIVSCFLAVGVRYHSSRFPSALPLCAAYITAMEAIWTDLLQFKPLQAFHNLHATMFCGNFGIILLHSAWFLTDNGKSALDVLEKMIKVTMMRGAQSGGVISFHPTKKGARQLNGVRSRVVNSKRTDLSVLVRRKVQHDNFGFGKGSFPSSFVPTFSGHTRFATSSKASMDGTHPHRWTPATPRRVYNFHLPHNGPHQYKPETILVENFITHNGDFDFYTVNGKTYDIEIVQAWLENVTKAPMPAVVDSCAIAGMIDLLRTQGCFGLSARYAVCLGMTTSKIHGNFDFPDYSFFDKLGRVFEDTLADLIKRVPFEHFHDTSDERSRFATQVAGQLQSRRHELIYPIKDFLRENEEGGPNPYTFCLATINAFFDNDLFMATKTFMANAKGSFGLCVTSSLDAHRQICLAARGQTMSIAFYPRKGIVCYGSEQAAVKAGLSVGFPGDDNILDKSLREIDNDALRLDLDDLGGEIILLDWGQRSFLNPPVSKPNQNLMRHDLMNGSMTAIIYQESKVTKHDSELYHRLTRLTRNRFVKPLREDYKDPVLKDIQDIPRVCQAIQDDWDSKKSANSLNRLTAYTLSRCLRSRLEAHVAGHINPRGIDILLTGCEVSLWLSEQFASDLQKAFPRLNITAVSSNKLLGLYGQEIAVPSTGFSYSPKTHDLQDTIVIIVSHSGGTFSPLSCSNLLQSTTKNIFVVTSEWDTQISKQLRVIDAAEDVKSVEELFSSRVFSTEVGMRPAEPCSVSVAATHQLLTNLFEYISVMVLDDHRYRTATGAVISEQDLQILEKCNKENIEALSEIVGANRFGYALDTVTIVEKDLRQAGDVWSEHILENAKAYIMSFLYIFVTLVSGYPIMYALAHAAGGLDDSNNWMYLIRAFDAAIYFWLPQINITLLRLVQGRNLLHRMVGRTVVIGDIPWVAQCAEAFLSKLFACSYSIAGLNVLSGNPVDHLVHRHTHKVVRGTLLVCGRPDGRLSALSTAEAAVSLSVNQASSIQSLGGSCESITIGHNPFKLPLSSVGIFLKRKRPLFLCERLLVEADKQEEVDRGSTEDSMLHSERNGWRSSQFFMMMRGRQPNVLDMSMSRHRDTSVHLRVNKKRSAPALMGAYMNFEGDVDTEDEDSDKDGDLTISDVIDHAIRERKWSDRTRKLFQAFDLDEDGFLTEDEFVKVSTELQSKFSEEELRNLFMLADKTQTGHLDYNEFIELLQSSGFGNGIKLPPSHRDDRGHIQIDASREKYFGETLRKYNAGKAGRHVDFMVARGQENAMYLYEARVASLQRFVAMTVMFHQMGTRVEKFFEKISFGFLGYRIDRTHSIMRIATTASPISGSDVKQQMRRLKLMKKVKRSVYIISVAYLKYKEKARMTSAIDQNAASAQL